MDVPFLDLKPQHRALRDQILSAWSDIYDSTGFVSGPWVAQFEPAFAAAHEVAHCVAVASGTDALLLALNALGTGPGDRVVVPANTFIATAEAVSAVGATPHPVDVDPRTKNIDVAAAAAAVQDDSVVGIIPVHLYGQPADMAPLLEAADRAGAWVLEDAAQAHLARYRGRPVGGFGRAAAFSFYPGKNLGATGEGGAVVTNDDQIASAVRALRDHGQTEKYHSVVPGYNARMHETVAAALAIKLPHLAAWTGRRREVAGWYRELLADIREVELPCEPEWAESVYHLFVVHVANRDRVRELLTATGVATGLHYPVPIHRQAAYADLGLGAGSFPIAERSAETLLSLPMFPELTRAEVEHVASSLAAALAQAAEEAS